MSRIGQKPIEVPAGVTVTVESGVVTVKGGKGELSYEAPTTLKVSLADGRLQVEPGASDKHTRAMHGTVRSLLANMIEGVNRGFQRQLVIQGVGYKAQINGQMLVLNLGYSHPIEYAIPEGVTVTVSDPTSLTISGPDKQKVGEVSARIRGYAPAEPYKGKGVRYRDEIVRRKAGKAVS